MPSSADPARLADRRRFLARLSGLAMAGGLAAGYGTWAAFAARYLYPSRPRAKRWLYVTRVGALRPGDSLAWVAPSGERIALARRGEGGGAADFVALSSTCPHLGCQVHWQPQHARFFCPCHNGAFDAEGRAIAGPPFEAGQSLPRYPLEVRDGLVFLEAPLERLAQAPERDAGEPSRTAEGAPSVPPHRHADRRA